MTITVLKRCMCYKNFNEADFRNSLRNQFNILDKQTIDHDKFKEIFMETLNQAPFMTKEFSKAIMKRSRFKNKFNKNPYDENKLTYKKQRNFCSNLLNRKKKKYFNNLDLNIFNDNKTF